MRPARRNSGEAAQPDEPPAQPANAAHSDNFDAQDDRNIDAQDDRLNDLAEQFNRYHDGGQRCRADVLLAYWNAGGVVIEIEALVGYKRGGGLLRLIKEGRLHAKKTQCYRYRDLYRMFPVDGNLSLWEAGYSVDEVEEAWQHLQGNSPKTKAKGKGRGKGKDGDDDAPGDNLFRTVILNSDNVMYLCYFSQGSRRDPDEIVNWIVSKHLRRMLDEEERDNPLAPGDLDYDGRLGEQDHQEDAE
jgi:hypothetical protein